METNKNNECVNIAEKQDHVNYMAHLNTTKEREKPSTKMEQWAPKFINTGSSI